MYGHYIYLTQTQQNLEDMKDYLIASIAKAKETKRGQVLELEGMKIAMAANESKFAVSDIEQFET
jgi:hypothetical protein